MKNQLLQKLFACAAAFVFTTNISAQDPWTNVAQEGIDNYYNSTFKALHVFNGNIYVGSESDQGSIYRSSNGNPGTWNQVYYNNLNYSIKSIASTANGAGMIYAAGYGGCCDSSKVMKSADGVNWSTYFASANSISTVQHIVPFKGLGSVDSIYLMDYTPGGSKIYKSHYNSNDPDNLSGSWDTVFDFATSSLPGARITATTVHNGKIYAGTDYGGTLWSSVDGINWIQNDSVGIGFSSMYTSSIQSLVSFGGYLYAGTSNNISGPEIWRSNNDNTWTRVADYGGSSFEEINSLNVANGELWVVLSTDGSDPGRILRSSDGLTFNTSSDCFGESGISGKHSNIVAFGNNIYFAGENYSSGGKVKAREIGATGAQIWRLCTATPPTVNIGADQTVCPDATVLLDAGPGALAYMWSNGDTTQTTNITSQGLSYVSIIGANGCMANDSVRVFYNPTPAITSPNIPPAICSGDVFNLNPEAISNVYIPEPPIHFTTNDSISDLLGVAVFDTVTVSGVTGLTAAASLMSVTIDSIYHTFAGDMLIGIYAPDGSYIDLSQNHGSGAINAYFGTEFRMNATENIYEATAPYTGAYIPDQPFSALSGGPNGTWVLKVEDFVGGDHGSLKGWSIRFKTDDSVMTFSWSPALGLSSTNTLTTVTTPTTSTTYTLSVTNSIGCTTEAPMNINVPELILPQAADTVCYLSSLPINITGGSANTMWSPATGLDTNMGQNVIASPSTSTHYYLTDTISGCPLSDSIFIYANGQLFNTAPIPVSICYADTASLTSNASGGTGPYSYSWDMGGSYYYGQTINEPFTTGTSFTVTATDAAGCTVTDFTNVSITPSTDIYGTVTYSGGPVTSSNIVIYKYLPYMTHFDTVQTTMTDGSGNYHFTAINHFSYLIEVFPNASYTTLVPTYVGDVFLWDSAMVVLHDCDMNDTLNIAAVEEAVLGGPGSLSGIIVEGDGFGRIPGEPIPGIDVKLGRNPGGQMITNTQTDPDGEYSFTGIPLNIPGEWYTVYVDIPGLGRDSSYSVVLDATTSNYDSLNYYVDSNSVFILDPGTTTHVTIDHAASTNIMNVYPNPSKGNSVIEYSINADAEVSLGIYNVLGVKVAELENKTQMTGTYKYVLNSKDHPLNSGVYFITLITNGKTSIQRLVITE